MSTSYSIVACSLAIAVCGALIPARVVAQSSESRISDAELSLRHEVSESLVGAWEGTFRARNPQTGEISELDYRIEYSLTRADGFLLGEGGLVSDDGEVRKWSHDVYSWGAETGERYISFNGFGVPITHYYTIEGLDVGEDTRDKWSFVRTHTGRVGSRILQQRVTATKDGDKLHLFTENRDPDSDDDFAFAYELILERRAND